MAKVDAFSLPMPMGRGGAIFALSAKIDLKSAKNVVFCILCKWGGGRQPPRFPPGYATGGARSQTREEIESGQRRECNFGSFPKLSPAIENERYWRGAFTAYSRVGADEDILFYNLFFFCLHLFSPDMRNSTVLAV